ncbi:hypermethylated in cancer 1 like isoform X2 [Pygocentrus nattereri]|uniref:hypermethylated in cancer 1 like isoform X2 n=1 Tax=Pygocentrus nattereri TaxID=42514 RepID=UPI000814876B|nr:hypermethylated in cancer 1 like isoform X2 [Pygocentrus nattereri]
MTTRETRTPALTGKTVRMHHLFLETDTFPAHESHLNEKHQGQEMELSNYASQLLLQLNQQRSKGFLCDVVIMVENTLFRAHKSVLAATSSYFKSLVLHDNLIHLDSELVDPDVFQTILDFIYTGRLSDESQGTERVWNLSTLLTVANYLQLHDLASLCSSKLEPSGSATGKSSLRTHQPFSPTSKTLPKREAEDTSSDIEAYASMVPPKKRNNGENKCISNNKQSFGLDLTKKSTPFCSVVSLSNEVSKGYSQSSVSRATANSLPSGVEEKRSPEKASGLVSFNGAQEWRRTPPRERSRRKGNVNGYFPVIKSGSHISQNLVFKSESPDDKESHCEENGRDQPENGESSDTSPNFVYRQESYLKQPRGDYPYVCIPCGKGFPSSESLNSHVESHIDVDMEGTKEAEEGDEDPAVTVLQEAPGTTKKKPLKSHKELDALRPFPCNICGKMFTQRGTMTRHMRSHLGLKPFACEECGMRFTRQYRLTEHMRVHSGEKPYECQICGGKFTQQRNLISHMRMHTSPT